MKKYNFAVVGATGLVGRTFLEVLEEYNVPINELHLFASSKSVGKTIIFKNNEYAVEELKEGCFKNIDFALFSAGGAVSNKWAPIAEKEGALVVDNSSNFRMEEDCALIVPEINLDDYLNKRRIIANPNCSTIQSVLPLKPLDDKYHLTRVNYATYQAVAGSGKKGIDDLERTRRGEKAEFYPYDISSTCIPEIDVACENGYTKEEMKMVNETRKILHKPSLLVSATCIRVPVKRSHGVVINAEFEKEISAEEVRKVLSSYEGIKVLDDLPNHIYPVSTIANNNDYVYVGRIRKDLSSPNGIIMYCVGDNVRKGAASNAIQIVCKIIERGEKDVNSN